MVKENLKIIIYGLKVGYLAKLVSFPRWCRCRCKNPQQARRILDQLEQTLGKDKTVIVLEAFRTKKMDNFEQPILGKLFLRLKRMKAKQFIFLMVPTIWDAGRFISSVYGIV